MHFGLTFLVLIGALSSPVWAVDCVSESSGISLPAGITTLAPKLQRLDYDLTQKKQPEGCPSPWHCEPISFDSVLLRSGYLPENPSVPFRGNVIFYEGLGDSMLNHMPLFKKLTDAGYRVIAFDYMGQGGSTGHMDNTRIEDIHKIGAIAWNKYARDTKKFPIKTVIGWSTGGLAAFYQAHLNQADQVILIAPGIAPKYIVGESHIVPFELLDITPKSLTTETYKDGTVNPHIDPIRPQTPLVVPDFAFDLLEKAFIARHRWDIPSRVRGLVLLSGPQDTYVYPKQTRKALAERAPNFQIVQFDGALHEIDNEVPAISQVAQNDILKFINSGDTP
jgi:alpha-beta hydrolase superfamily lysophospholipase